MYIFISSTLSIYWYGCNKFKEVASSIFFFLTSKYYYYKKHHHYHYLSSSSPSSSLSTLKIIHSFIHSIQFNSTSIHYLLVFFFRHTTHRHIDIDRGVDIMIDNPINTNCFVYFTSTKNLACIAQW